ncbi:MAG: hemerythrin domain-containing protein [Pyrinomonadaceae bacterium]
MEQTTSELLAQDHEKLAALLEGLHAKLSEHDAQRSLELLDLFWARLAMHIRAENVYLFPAVLNAVSLHNAGIMPAIDKATSVIESLRNDHNFFMDQLSQAIKTMREMISGAEKDTQTAGRFELIRSRVNAVTARLEAHNELEEEQVYTWPALMLSQPQRENLRAALKRELENLPPRFGKS